MFKLSKYLIVIIICFSMNLLNYSIFSNEKTITIVFVGDFTDVTQSYCISAYHAVELAVSEVNASGGLLGKKVILIKKDGGVDPQKHYELVSEAAMQPDVAAIFGGSSTVCIIRASDASREQKIPYLISVGNSQKVVVDYGHPYVFLFEANSWMETRGFSIFVSLMPWKRYAWIGPDYVWGRETFSYFKEHFRLIGNPIRWVAEAWHPLGNDDFSSQIEKIIKAKPDALVIASWGEDMQRIVIQSKKSHIFDNMAVFGWFMSEYPDNLLPDGVWTLTRAPFNLLIEKYPQSKDFTNKYYEHYNEYPIGFSICSYDSFIAWKEAVIKAGTSDRQVIAETLKGLHFTGLRGESYIRPIDGQMNCSTYFGRMKYQEEYKTAVLESIIEIPSDRTWLSEEEIRKIRQMNNR